MAKLLLLLVILSLAQLVLCRSGTDELKAQLRELLAAIDKEVVRFSKLKNSSLAIHKNCEKKISELRYEEIEELTKNNLLYWDIQFLKKQPMRNMDRKLFARNKELVIPHLERRLKKVDSVQELLKPEKPSEIENWEEFLKTKCIEIDSISDPYDILSLNRSVGSSVTLNDLDVQSVLIRKINHVKGELEAAEEMNSLQKTLNRELKQECRDRIETLDHEINELIIGIIECKPTRSKYTEEFNSLGGQHSRVYWAASDLAKGVYKKRKTFVEFCQKSNALLGKVTYYDGKYHFYDFIH